MKRRTPAARPAPRPAPEAPAPATDEPDRRGTSAAALNEALGDAAATIIRAPLSWDGSYRAFRHPLDYLGHDGGAGVGSGPGMAVGAALACAAPAASRSRFSATATF